MNKNNRKVFNLIEVRTYLNLYSCSNFLILFVPIFFYFLLFKSERNLFHLFLAIVTTNFFLLFLNFHFTYDPVNIFELINTKTLDSYASYEICHRILAISIYKIISYLYCIYQIRYFNKFLFSYTLQKILSLFVNSSISTILLTFYCY